MLGSLPLAIAGALLFPFVEWTTINVYSQVDIITLVGQIAMNGILIVEFAKSSASSLVNPGLRASVSSIGPTVAQPTP